MDTNRSKGLLVKLSQLELDKDNYRLAKYGTFDNEDQVVKTLWEKEKASEIAESIGASGYIDGDPIVVKKIRGGKYLVQEGNRRVTALKVLSDRKLRKKLELKVTADSTVVPEKIRVRFFGNQAVVQKYLGIRHLKGPRMWDPYGKAAYTAFLFEEQKLDIDTVRKEVGDKSNKTVLKQYQGFKVLRQAEEGFSFNRENSSGRFNFSHLYEALQQETFRKFLGISEKDLEAKRNPIAEENLWRLRKLLTYLFGDKTHNVSKVIVSQNPDLKILGVVLSNPKAAAQFEKNRDLKEAKALLVEVKAPPKPKYVKIQPLPFELVTVPKDMNWPALAALITEVILIAKQMEKFPIAFACLLRCIMEESVKLALVRAKKYGDAVGEFKKDRPDRRDKDPGLSFLLQYLTGEEAKHLIQKPVLSGLAEWKGVKPQLDAVVHGSTSMTGNELKQVSKKIQIPLSKILDVQTLLSGASS